MTRVKLDAIDRRILADLQENGRTTNVELARNAGISAPPCLRRVRALEENGVIRLAITPTSTRACSGSRSRSSPSSASSRRRASGLAAFEALVGEWPEVRECHMVRGGGDFLLKIVALDTAHENALTTRLTGAPDVVRVTTFPVIQSSKEIAGVPMESSPARRVSRPPNREGSA